MRHLGIFLASNKIFEAPGPPNTAKEPIMPADVARGDGTSQYTFPKPHDYVPLPLALRTLYS